MVASLRLEYAGSPYTSQGLRTAIFGIFPVAGTLVKVNGVRDLSGVLFLSVFPVPLLSGSFSHNIV